MAHVTNDRRAWIKVLVHAVTKAHQAERIVFVLGLGDVFLDLALVTDFREHVQYSFVRATVCRTP